MADKQEIPELTISTRDSMMLANLKAAVERCCESYDIAFSSVARVEGSTLVLSLNHGEGMELFKADPLLNKQLHLFDGTKPHTDANLKEMNEQNARYGVSVSRSTSLDAEFKTKVIKAEKHIPSIEIRIPESAATPEAVIAKNQVTVIGEIHDQESARLTIAAQSSALARGGALVMEGIPSNRQGLLDAYLASKPRTPMPGLIRLSLEAHAGKDREGYYSAINLIEDQKKAGVPVYAIDSDASLLVNYGMVMSGVRKQGVDFKLPLENPENYTHKKRENPLDYRLMLLNEQAFETVQAIKARHTGKILVDVGGSHAMPENGVPGIGDYVKGGQLVMYNVSGHEKPEGKVSTEVIKGNDYPFPITRAPYLKFTADPTELKQRLDQQTQAQSHPVGTGQGRGGK